MCTQVKKLTQWLNEWNSIHRASTTTTAAAEDEYDNSDEDIKPKAKNKGKAKPAAAKLNIKEKACLISGPPGIGKTTQVFMLIT
jgi:DNA polymerase III delta prime subunit